MNKCTVHVTFPISHFQGSLADGSLDLWLLCLEQRRNHTPPRPPTLIDRLFVQLGSGWPPRFHTADELVNHLLRRLQLLHLHLHERLCSAWLPDRLTESRTPRTARQHVPPGRV